jgi:hypothetical protein
MPTRAWRKVGSAARFLRLGVLGVLGGRAEARARWAGAGPFRPRRHLRAAPPAFPGRGRDSDTRSHALRQLGPAAHQADLSAIQEQRVTKQRRASVRRPRPRALYPGTCRTWTSQVPRILSATAKGNSPSPTTLAPATPTPAPRTRAWHMAQQGVSRRWLPGPAGDRSDWSGPPIKYFKHPSLPQTHLALPAPCPLPGVCQCLFLSARREALFLFPGGPCCSRFQGNVPVCSFSAPLSCLY